MTGQPLSRRSVGARVGNVLLTLAAAAGAVCIVLVLLAVFFHISLIMFKTDSMAPTIPEGSLAVVRQIPASQIRLGEVVTVNRDGQLPISHRVVSIRDAGPQTREIVLRGDANPVDDPLPYTVTNVRLVIWSVPELAYLVVWLSNPIVIAILAVGVAALVTWAFWPTGASKRQPRKRHASGHSTTIVTILVVGGIAVSGIAVASQGLTAQPADAAPSVQTIAGPVITLVSIGDPSQMSSLTPGVPVLWQVGVSAHAAQPGTVQLSIVANGPLAEQQTGLVLQVSGCEVEWVGSQCAQGEQLLLTSQPASSLGGVPQQLESMTTAEARWVLVTVSVPAGVSTTAGTSTLQLTADGAGDRESAGGDVKALARTGEDVWPALGVAAGAIATGLSLAGSASLFRRRRVTP